MPESHPSSERWRVDTTMKTMAGLLTRVKALEEEGLSAWLWTGGYNVPPTTVMGSIREDMLFVDEVVGADGRPAVREKFLAESSRNINLVGAKYGEP